MFCREIIRPFSLNFGKENCLLVAHESASIQTMLCDREPSSCHVFAGKKKSSFQTLIETIPSRDGRKFGGSKSLDNVLGYLYSACPAPSMDTLHPPAVDRKTEHSSRLILQIILLPISYLLLNCFLLRMFSKMQRINFKNISVQDFIRRCR